VEVDVRGRLNENDWTNWQQIDGGGTTLPKTVSSVQMRAV
jgi:hypothetical protein